MIKRSDILCRVAGHRRPEGAIWNEGYHFGECARCHTALIRYNGGRWRRVPKGSKVVWRPITSDQRAFRDAVLHWSRSPR